MKEAISQNQITSQSPLVIVESPYRGSTPEVVALNIRYAQLCIRDCLKRGESPFASHLLYTQKNVLRDNVQSERTVGLVAGWSWMRIADRVAVYLDRGISQGMHLGIKKAQSLDKEIIYRHLNPKLYKEKMGEPSQLFLLPRKL